MVHDASEEPITMNDKVKSAVRPETEKKAQPKKPYTPPQVVSQSMLEVVAAVCDPAQNGKNTTGTCMISSS
jgi:hypothetical protein